MRQGKIVVFLFTIVFLAAAAFCLSMSLQAVETGEAPVDQDAGFSVAVSLDGNREIIKPYENDFGEYCIFLPGHPQPDQVLLLPDTGWSVCVNGAAVSGAGMELSAFGDFCWQITAGKGKEPPVSRTLRFVSSTELPVMFVDVRSGDMSYIHAYKDNEEPGTLRLYLPDGTLAYGGNLESVKGRGNATWEWEKKPYNLKLRTEADLLGMGSASGWVLLANTYDDSHIRNKIVYETAERLGLDFSPESRWVELYLNGEYAGLYLLCEKNEIHPQRVNLDSRWGNLISIEKEDRLWEYSEAFLTEGGIPVRIRSSGDSGAVQERIRQLEQSILSEDGMDPETGKSWLELIDLDSWAKKYLIEEAFGNLDAGSISQFFYWEADGKIYAGPVWDYDVSMGNSCNWQLRDVNMLYAGRPHLWNPEDTPWFYALSQKPEFRERVAELYRQQLRPLLTELTVSEIGLYSSEIAAAAERNRLRWNTGSQPGEAEQIRTYLLERMEFLDGLWLEQRDYVLVQMYINWHVMACYALEPGQCLPFWEVPQGTDTIVYVDWCDMETGEPFDFSSPVTEDTFLYLKEAGSEAVITSSGGGLSEKVLYFPAAVLLVLLSAIIAVWLYRIRSERKRKDSRRREGEQRVK